MAILFGNHDGVSGLITTAKFFEKLCMSVRSECTMNQKVT